MKKKLFLSLICPQVYPLFNPAVKAQFGGAEIQMSHLAKKLVGQNEIENVSLLVADYEQPELEVRENIHFFKALLSKKNTFSQITHFFLSLHKPQTDVFLQVTLTPFSGLIALYCRLIGTKFVYWVASDADTDGTLPFAANPIKKFLSELVFTFSNLIIVQNQKQKENLRKKGFDSLLISSFYAMSQTPPAEKKPEFHLWVARSAPLKRAELFIELASYFPTEKFVMICQKSSEGSQEYYDELQAKAAKLANFEFIKYVPVDANMSDYFKKAKTFTNTSTFEGVPTTFIEASKNSTPILALNINPDSMFDHYQCGFFCQNSMEILKEKLQFLLDNENIYGEMAQKSFAYAQENHNLELNTEKLVKAILAF